MDIGVPIRELGAVECGALIDAVKGLDAAVWDRCDIRQQAFDVHRRTKSIVLLFAEGWPNLKVRPFAGWPILADVVNPVIDRVLSKHYPPGGHVIRSMVANLVAGGEIEEHYDAGPSFAIGHRIHVPLQTNPGVRFTIDGQLHTLKVGEAYEINNLRYHAVLNDSDEDRYHLIFDYVPPNPAAAAAR
ncbi:MAG: hypothetical protein EP335_02675 [Alphaproteobacteria bacterium]|nr:MAG: hypothetical protein EP335_02675 [Alphaproteobacteria bacterium]